MTDHEKTYLDLDFAQRLKTESISRQYGKTLYEIMNKLAEVVVTGTFRYSTPAGHIDFVVDPIDSEPLSKPSRMRDQRRIYISGPISGQNPEECIKRFEEAEQLLTGLGYRVFNPKKNGLPEDAGTRKHMHRDLAELTNEEDPFDAIYMMRRWTHSKGCKVEFDVATAIGLPVLFEESGELVKFE